MPTNARPGFFILMHARNYSPMQPTVLRRARRISFWPDQRRGRTKQKAAVTAVKPGRPRPEDPEDPFRGI
jgi:hypothetical protein